MFNWIKKILAPPDEKNDSENETEGTLTITTDNHKYTTKNKEEIGELLKIFSENFSKKQ